MKFRRKGVIALTAALCVAFFASAAMALDEDELRTAVQSSGTVTLNQNIPLTNGALTISNGVSVTLDLAGYTLSRDGSSEAAGTDTYVIEVDGATLTIEDSSNGNGRIESINSNSQRARGIRIGSGSQTGNPRGNGGAVILNGGTVYADPEHFGYGIALIANCASGERESVNASL